jgi:HD-GYP domain-containing protein (c-di-GMP phosphodiesterase class II)
VDWGLALVLLLLAVAATQFPLHLSLTLKVSVATAVFFAAVLLLPAQHAALLAAAAVLASTVVSVVRRRWGPTPAAAPPRDVFATAAFNVAQGYLSVLAAGSVLALGDVSARTLASGAAPLIMLAALTMYLINLLAVSTMVALSQGTSPLRVFLDTQHTVAVQFAVLYLLGLSVAWLTVRYAWVPALSPVPAALLYLSLRRVVQLSEETIRAVERMADMVDRRDPYTFEHSRRVAEYSVLLSRRIGLSRDEVQILRLGAKVHDLGKIAVPDSVLLKPGSLTPEEVAQMRAHPRVGYDILSEFREYGKVRELVLTHHERFAGDGYPTGMIAGRLPLVAQVIPVADSLDAMTTARPYRDPLPWAVALDELQKGSGTQWNPQVVAAALEVFADKRRPGAAIAKPALAVV